jgi:hypothetical protein
MKTGFQLDESMESVIASESLDGRNTLFHDLRHGFYAKAVLAERAHSQTTHREASVIPGDMEMREVGRMSAEGFHYLWQTHGMDEMNGDDLFNFQARHNPNIRTHYKARNPVVFFPAAHTHQIIQATKYTPARV